MSYSFGLAACLSALTLFSPNIGHTQQFGGPLGDIPVTMGVGHISCSEWTEARSPAVINWIGGFWSGLNIASATQRRVGRTAQGQEILLDVLQECKKRPTATIDNAAAAVYLQFAIRESGKP